MPHYSYSQSLDTLPIRELNDEFLKGIEAREKLHILKQVVKLDSIQLSLYKDSIVPSMQKGLDISKTEIMFLDKELDKKNKELKFFYKLTGILTATLTLLLLI